MVSVCGSSVHLFKLRSRMVFRWVRSLMRLGFMVVLLFQMTELHCDTKRVLFIGNSYTFHNNMPDIAAEVARSAGDQLIFATSAYSTYNLQLHSTNATTLELIRQGGWDYVVLQENSQYPSEPLSWVEQNVFPYAAFLSGEVRRYNPGAETMFYITWGRRDGDADRCSRLPVVCTYTGMDDLTRERYMMMADRNDGVLSPVGPVWRYLRENHSSIELYVDDGSHPSAAGSYAAACCFYAAVFRKDPGLITYNYSVGSSTASTIRSAARTVVYNNLSTWHLGNSSTYTITSSAGSGGTITPSGTRTVHPGDNITYRITPNSGYYISNVRVDNVSVGSPSSYTFSNVSSNHVISATFGINGYTITAGAGAGGSVTPSGSVGVSHGSDITFSITPSTGYSVADVRIDNVSAGSVTSYTFRDVTENHSLYATFSAREFRISASAGTGGSISPSGSSGVTFGSRISYTISPETGYRIQDVRIDGISAGTVSSYTFTDIRSDHTIEAIFTPITFRIEASAATGGSITPSGTRNINFGSQATFTITPGTGYRILDVRVDGSSVGAVSTYTFSNVESDHTIAASFILLTYNIDGSASSGGSISPAGTSRVNHGSQLSFTITPSTGYRIQDVRVDGVSAGAVSVYTFTGISSDHTIEASFILRTFSIDASASEGGSISPPGSTSVTYGEDQAYIITPSTGFEISDIRIDNVSVGPVESYTFNNVVRDHTITAHFKLKTYVIATESNQGGSVSPSGPRTVDHGSALEFTFSPDFGYRIRDVIIDGISMGMIRTYTFGNISGDHTVSVKFEPIPIYNLTAVSGEGGSVTPAGITDVFEGSDLAYSIVPDSGYRILNVTVDNLSLGSINEYTFSGISSDHRITASFTTSSEVLIYPNPFSLTFNILIKSPEDSKFDLVVTDFSGRIVLIRNSVPGNENTPVLIQGDKGYYFVKVLLGGRKIGTFKILKSGS